ncbi:MAG TPA: ABC transporter ATP-binding protein [Dongiaceae bacterium]|jgi:peptide/nickel transport system ATP-binding protein|nr:ABC transporter ATP-binding protein [Dongiaceae bacterium]
MREGVMAQAKAKTEGEILNVRNLRIEAVTETGTRVTLVDDVSFNLKAGEVLGLIGESGAGKSTIGLSTLVYARTGCQITGGQILFHNRDLRGLDVKGRQNLRGVKVAYIAQSAAAAFNPAHTIYEQVCEVALQHGVMNRAQARMDAIRLFKELDLPNPDVFGSRYPHQVSGGQLQRAMAAMAMIAKPDLLVFDEPTTALDVTTQVEVLASFKKLIREHRTAALYISHDLAVVAQIADRIMVLRRGQMVEEGEATQILQRPQMDYTRMLVAERVAAERSKFVEGHAEGDRPILDVKNVVAAYRGTVRIIDDVSIDLRRGDTLAIVGESGSGKSTLARVIVGLLPRQKGDILFDGTSLPPRLQDRSKDQLRRIQMIYQMPDVALNPRQTLLDIIGRPVQFYFGKNRAEVRARVEELLRQIDLPPEYITRRPHELSGGQKQRVCIARALAAQPDIIICDEVTSALDPLVADEILRLLRRIQDETGVAFLFITHDLGTVRRIANKVAVMLKGKLVAAGPTQQVFNPPFHPYTELLLSSVPEIRPDWLDEVLRRRRKAS